jgi:membrane-associated phospholipid phosphatase
MNLTGPLNTLGLLLSLGSLLPAQSIAPRDSDNVSALKSGSVCARNSSEEDLKPLPWKRVGTDVACQQFDIWTFPKQLRRPKMLLPTLGVGGATAGFIIADSRIAQHFETSRSFGQFNRTMDGRATEYALIALPFSFYGASLIAHNKYGQETAIEAGETLLDGELLSKSLKMMTGRPGPNHIAQATGSSGPWFSTRAGSFPSGHATAAFSVASVFARRYRASHKWAPYVAYGLATAVAFSTVTQSSHYSSDVFLGSALGFAIGEFGVRHHATGGTE